MRGGVVITGGGTGGHVYPGLALADDLRRLRPGLPVAFIGCGRRIEGRLVPAAGWPFLSVSGAGLRGRGAVKVFGGLTASAMGLAQSIGHLSRLSPRLVVGTGGYVTGPVVAAAWLLRRRIAIHEQNLSPGWTNRVLARMADVVMVSFPETAAAFRRRRVMVTGNPVRREAMAGTRTPPSLGVFRILVMGGSQGAAGLNRMVARALEILGGEGVEVVHQTGSADLYWVSRVYEPFGAGRRAIAFIEDIGRYYAWADLVVCRAGATTLAELAANGLCAVLVPFPSAAGGHQEENASYLSSRGAAVMVKDRGEAGGEELARVVRELRDDSAGREAMAKAMAAVGRPRAAAAMSQACLELLDG